MNDEIDLDEDDRLAERRNRQSGKDKGGMNKLIPYAFVAFILVITPFVVLGPQGVGGLLGLSTSDSEQLQQASQIDTGISTALPAPQVAPDTDVPNVEFPVSAPNDAEKKRLAELEEQLKRLQNQPKGDAVTSQQIADLLNAQMAAFRDEAKRAQEARDKALNQQIAALKASLASRGPSAEELAEKNRLERLAEEERQRKLREQEALREEARKRAEERRQAAEELRLKQLESDSVLFDGSEEGETAPGSTGTNNNQNVRELSSNEQFLQTASASGFETSRANNLGDLSRIIVQGTIISAALETAINTELPGSIRAQVTEPVFSYDGEQILMPAGTRLIGTFNSDINTAQKRVLIAWNRAITPNGDSVELGSTGTDYLGRSGTLGNVDSRFLQRFGSTALITAISAIPSFLASESDNDSIDAANGIANDASGDLEDEAESALEDRLNLPPIIRVPQGEGIRVFVNRDLVF